MFGRGKEKAPAQSSPAAPLRDVVDAFPRGLPDGDRNRPLGTSQWVTSQQGVDLAGQWEPGAFLLGRDTAGRYAGVEDDRHILTVAGSRAGKGTSLIVPNLLHWNGSALCIDPKGELATITASRRGQGSKWSTGMSGEVYALDPFERVTGPATAYRCASFNPLKNLDPDSDAGLEMASMIADALVIQSKGDGAYWTQSARAFLRGLLLFTAKTQGENAHLPRLRQMLMQNRDSFNGMLTAMEAFDGTIADAARAMSARPDSEKWSVLSTCQVHTDFLEGNAMASVLMDSTFSLDDMKTKRMTVYLCLPATRLGTHGRWLRMMISLALDSAERTGPILPGQHRILFVMDEFAALGRLPMIEAAAAHISSFGVKLWTVVQDVTQLQRDYELAWETFMGNAGVLTFHSNTDMTTLEHVSKRLGMSEVVRIARGASEGWQRSGTASGPTLFAQMMGQGSANRAAQSGRQGGQTATENVQQAPLMQPDEVARCFARDTGNILAFIARSDVPPLALKRCFYFDSKDDALFGGLYDPVPGQAAPPTLAQRKAGREARPAD